MKIMYNLSFIKVNFVIDQCESDIDIQDKIFSNNIIKINSQKIIVEPIYSIILISYLLRLATEIVLHIHWVGNKALYIRKSEFSKKK